MTISRAGAQLTALVLLAVCSTFAQTPAAQPPPPGAPPGLVGPSWQLVRFQGGDGKTLTPDDRTKYTIQFGADRRLTTRIDCNLGRGAWTSSGPGQLQLGALAITRARCGTGSLHDRIVRDWGFVRSYVIRDGHLFLSLMADGGNYEFESISGAKPVPPPPTVASTGPFAYACTQAGGVNDTMNAAFYQTQPALVLVERGGQTRPAFRVPAASGAKYEGQNLTFWDARGEVSLIWSGVEARCKRR